MRMLLHKVSFNWKDQNINKCRRAELLRIRDTQVAGSIPVILQGM